MFGRLRRSAGSIVAVAGVLVALFGVEAQKDWWDMRAARARRVAEREAVARRMEAIEAELLERLSRCDALHGRDIGDSPTPAERARGVVDALRIAGGWPAAGPIGPETGSVARGYAR